MLAHAGGAQLWCPAAPAIHASCLCSPIYISDRSGCILVPACQRPAPFCDADPARLHAESTRDCCQQQGVIAACAAGTRRRRGPAPADANPALLHAEAHRIKASECEQRATGGGPRAAGARRRCRPAAAGRGDARAALRDCTRRGAQARMRPSPGPLYGTRARLCWSGLHTPVCTCSSPRHAPLAWQGHGTRQRKHGALLCRLLRARSAAPPRSWCNTDGLGRTPEWTRGSFWERGERMRPLLPRAIG